MDKNEEMVRFSGIFAWIFGFSFVMNMGKLMRNGEISRISRISTGIAGGI